MPSTFDDLIPAPAAGTFDDLIPRGTFDDLIPEKTEPPSLLGTLQYRTLKGFEGGIAAGARGAERLLDVGPLPNSYRAHAAQLEAAVPILQRADEIEVPELQPSRFEQIRREPAYQSQAAQQSATERIRSELMRPASSLREAAQEIGGAAGTVAQNIPGHETAGRAAEMAGGMLPILGAAMVPGVGAPLSSALAGLQTGGDTYDRALEAYKAAGLDEETAKRLADRAAGNAGLTSAATFSLLPGPLKGSGAAIMGVLKAETPVVKAALGLAGAATEGGTLMAADHLARSAQEMQSFNPHLTWQQALRDAGEQFLVGGIVSGALHAPGALARAVTPELPADLPLAPVPKVAPAEVSADAMKELEAALRANQIRPRPPEEPAIPAAAPEPPAPVAPSAAEPTVEREMEVSPAEVPGPAASDASTEAEPSKLQAEQLQRPEAQILPTEAAPVKRVAHGSRAGKVFAREEELGGPDVLTFIRDELGGMASRSAARAAHDKEWWRLNNSLYDDATPLARPQHNLIYGGRLLPDQVAQAAFDRGLIGEPTPSELWAAISKASAARAGVFRDLRQQEKLLENEAEWAKATAKGELRVTPEDLEPGDEFEVEGERFKVLRRNSASGEVTLEDGTKWGRQTLAPGQSIWVEKPAEALAERVAESPTELQERPPKLRPMENQGDLLAGQEEPFRLVGERGTDADRIERERLEAETAKAEREKYAARHQQELLERPAGYALPGEAGVVDLPYGRSEALSVEDRRRQAPPAGHAEFAFGAPPAPPSLPGEASQALRSWSVEDLRRAFAQGERVSSIEHARASREIPGWNIKGKKIATPADFAALLLPLRSPYHESLKVAVLDEDNVVVYSQILYAGNLDTVNLRPGDFLTVMGKAGPSGKSLMLSHNHPSGKVEPSAGDVHVQQNLEKLAAGAGFTVLDHVITNGEEYFSFRGNTTERIGDPKLAPWEVLPRSTLRDISTAEQFAAVVATLRQVNSGTGHLIAVTTRRTITAVERVPLNERAMVAALYRMAGEEAPSAYLLDTAELTGPQSRAMAMAVNQAAKYVGADFLDYGNAEMASAASVGAYSSGRFIREEAATPSTDDRLEKLARDIIDPRNVGASFFAGLDRYAAYGAVQAARVALKAGKTTAEAIESGVDWLRKNYQGTWDETRFRSDLAEWLARPLVTPGPQTFIDPAVQKEVEPLRRARTLEMRLAKQTGDFEKVKAINEQINALLSQNVTPVGLQAARHAKIEQLADKLDQLRNQAAELRARGEPVPAELANELAVTREDFLAAQQEFARMESAPPAGRLPRSVDSSLRRAPSPGGGRPAPEFSGRERLPSGGLRDILDGLFAWRQRVGNWWSRRGPRESVIVKREAADNRAGRAANEAANHVRLTLNRAFGDTGSAVRARRNGLREAALVFAVEADGDRGRLADFHEMIANSERAKTISGRIALDAIEFAAQHWDRLQPAANEYRTLTEIEREEELNAGFNSNEWEGGYVYHRWQRSPAATAANPAEPSAAPTPFRKPRTAENYAAGIAGGGVPRSFNALDLLSNRIADGQRALNEANWLVGLKSMQDPVSGEPLAVGVLHKPRRPAGTPRPEAGELPKPEDFESGRQPEWITVPEVPGYVVQKIGPVEFAIKPEYAGLLTDLTAKSWFEGGEIRKGIKNALGASKSVMLLFDTFHLGRLAIWRASLLSGGLGYQKGATLLDFTTSDIQEMGRRGEIPQNWVEGLLENRRRLDLAVASGFNVGQILDNVASDWIHKLPIAGPFNHWLFGQYQRGAMAEAWLIEFERTREMFPNRSEQEVARQVTRDLNSRFGNLGRQGLIRSKTGQDLARILFLAPQWNESLVRSELGAAGQLLKAPIDSVQQRRLVAGTLLRSTGGMILGTFLANQILNYAFRGKPTWENQEEGWDKKISAWIPDAVGNGPGFFLNPLALPAEYTHLVSGQLSRSKDSADAAWRIVNGRLSSPSRALLMLATRKDALGRSLKPGEVLPAVGKALIPAPIGGGAIAAGVKQVATGEPSEKFPGQFQKQIMASVGLKTDQAPNAEQRIRALAHDFNAAKGIVPSAEFYAGDYTELTEALRRGNKSDAQSALDDLLKKHTKAEIAKHFERWMLAPYTGQRAREGQFMRSLTPEQRRAYEQSRVARRELARQARALLAGRTQ